MKIYKKPIKLILKHTDTTINDLIVWFKEWDVKRYGTTPCITQEYHGFCFYEGSYEKFKTYRCTIYLGYRVCPGMYMWDFVRRYVDDEKFRKDFLSELERMRGEFE